MICSFHDQVDRLAREIIQTRLEPLPESIIIIWGSQLLQDEGGSGTDHRHSQEVFIRSVEEMCQVV